MHTAGVKALRLTWPSAQTASEFSDPDEKSITRNPEAIRWRAIASARRLRLAIGPLTRTL